MLNELINHFHPYLNCPWTLDYILLLMNDFCSQCLFEKLLSSAFCYNIFRFNSFQVKKYQWRQTARFPITISALSLCLRPPHRFTRRRFSWRWTTTRRRSSSASGERYHWRWNFFLSFSSWLVVPPAPLLLSVGINQRQHHPGTGESTQCSPTPTSFRQRGWSASKIKTPSIYPVILGVRGEVRLAERSVYSKSFSKACVCRERQVWSPLGGLSSAEALQVLSYVNRTNVKSTSNCLR